VTGAELVALCRARFRNETQQGYQDADWIHLLSQAQFDMLGEARMPVEETSTTVNYTTGDGDEDLPAGVFAVRTVRNATTEMLLTPIHSWRIWEQLYPTDSERGEPVNYRLTGRTLQIRPRPNQATSIIVRHWTPQAAITLGTEPVIPADFHRSLADGALAAAMLDDGELEQAGMYEQRWGRAIQRFKHLMAQERLGRHVPVSKRFNDWV
jgi:hypothetical protein